MKVDYIYKSGGKESAASLYNKHPRSTLLNLTIDEFNTKINVGMNVEDAKALAAELLEYANDVEEYAKVLKDIGTTEDA